MKPSLKNRIDRRARVNIFPELLLTDKPRHYLRMNVDHTIDHTLIFMDGHFYITYTCTYTVYIGYLILY